MNHNNFILIALSDFVAELLYFFSGFVPSGKDKKRRDTIGSKLLPGKYKHNSSAVVISNLLFWLAVLSLLVFWVARMS